MSEAPRIKRFAEKVGDVSVWQTRVGGEWEVTIQHDGREVTLWRVFDSPGAALDAAIQWGDDRGLEVQWMGHRFPLVRPGEMERGDTDE